MINKVIHLILLIILFSSCNQKENKKASDIKIKTNELTLLENKKDSLELRNKRPSLQDILKITNSIDDLIHSNSGLKKINYYLDKKTTKETIDIIDKNVKENKIKKYEYPNRSFYGGRLQGYFQNDSTLKYIESHMGVEFYEDHNYIYWHNENIIKIIYREHRPNWEIYRSTYTEDKYEFDASKITYADTTFIISFSNKGIDFEKRVKDKIISTKIDSTLVRRRLNHGYQMRKEIEIGKEWY